MMTNHRTARHTNNSEWYVHFSITFPNFDLKFKLNMNKKMFPNVRAKIKVPAADENPHITLLFQTEKGKTRENKKRKCTL